MATRSLGWVVLITAAAAIALAPSASAEAGGNCAARKPCADPSPEYVAPERNFVKDIPKGWTNETQFVRPGYNPFGTGPQPPLLALE